jgi:hypothetical protein
MQPSTVGNRFASSVTRSQFPSTIRAPTYRARPNTASAGEQILAPTDTLSFLEERDMRRVRDIKARTYANLFGLVERIIEIATQPRGTAHEGLLRLGQTLEQQQMFRHLERMAAASQPEGYAFAADALLAEVREKMPWTLIAFIYRIEVFVLANHKESIERDPRLSTVLKTVFADHWREQCKHVTLAEAEWARENAQLSSAERAQAARELSELSQAMDRLLDNQSRLDAQYFSEMTGRVLSEIETERMRASLLEEYRHQYAESGRCGPFLEEALRRAGSLQSAEMCEAFASAVA